MKRLWVVECQFNNGQWDICKLTPYRFTFTDYYNAHRVKRKIHKYLYIVAPKIWAKKRFRVREYIPR